ncbi:hypothetical protein A2774_01730 [Candidatus Roizmanbacteria bacterium RIFCSPHIGHO2_01_FULL_39_12c]|uniref:Triosephosphate isomerase n=1 Tax=Candidatus Roizmanbacteria bacterium RIFCSPHIGHO2_01_FULL_39_12c TaxID=1802031 RepID=A0A1F7GAY4_9BACT|nr:MAG: hypothetical protein A2774_01730 [Candidatus Roizmanbacteria bacterium RIFCSPHIGHO2_01_FULL_39_12c]OGK46912.1 MAG: hypothetical protein A2963_05140 [Candidatus Roizmanbacteria bacterium RIFCSPLOWO2_01_FULL_40_13]
MYYFIANWKANKNLSEALSWIDDFISNTEDKTEAKFIISPPAPFLYPLKEKIKGRNNVYLAAQDISRFAGGSYTGEVTAKSIQSLVDFAIIGHSERRNLFQENYDALQKKTELAQKYNIEPIFCLRDEKDQIPATVKIVAYEPVYAIGSGNNEPLEQVIKQKAKIIGDKQLTFLYGGSVNEKNSSTYLKSGQLDGFLVGNASLNPSEFLNIVKSA